jgi:hypothetical protein
MRSVTGKLIALLLLICLTVTGVSATWVYIAPPTEMQESVGSQLGSFTYGAFYITKKEIKGGSYSSASFRELGDVNIEADITLNKNTASSLILDVTFYNNTDVTYYYNETRTVSTDNKSIGYTVSGIEQKEAVPAKSFKTLTVTFEYTGSNVSDAELLSELHFNFVVDKDSIGIVAAQTAVTRFKDILNNVVSPNSYQLLEDTMNKRGTNSSSVSYIGNVSGAKDADSTFIQSIFTEEFLTMDLDGDGKSEPITLMIKRENLDGNVETGDEYTYSTLFGSKRTVQGVEMTIYITSEGFDKSSLDVYAATFTKLYGENEWIQVVPLTKGKADANKYSFSLLGGNNSFNTDTWLSGEGSKTMDTLTVEAMKELNTN